MNRLHHSADTTAFPCESMVWPRPEFAPSVFAQHRLKSNDITQQKTTLFQPDWIVLICLLCFVVLAWSQVYYAKRMRQIAKAPISQRYLNQLVRDGNLFKERISPALGFLYLVNLSLFIYQANHMLLGYTPLNLSGFTLYLLILGGVVSFWLVKLTMIRLLGFTFKTRSTTNEYLLNTLVFCLNQGLILLPLMVFTLFLKSETILYISLFSIALLFLFRVVRGFFIGLRLTRFSYLFLIVYLCALEFLPLLVMVKFFLKNL